MADPLGADHRIDSGSDAGDARRAAGTALSGLDALPGLRTKTLALASIVTVAGLAVGPAAGLGALAGALISIAVLESQAWLAALVTGSGAAWKRRLGLVWLVKYPTMIAVLYLIVVHAPVNAAALLVGVTVVPAAILWQAVS